MDEQHAVLGIHRAIDKAAEGDDEAIIAAATLFPVYGAGGQGWSDRFARMLVRHGQVESVEDVFPSLEESLVELTGDQPRHTWQGIRRLQSIAALTRVSDDHAPDGESAPLVHRALGPLLQEDSDIGAERFHALLADPPSLHHEGWDEHVQRLVDEGALHPTYAVRSGPSCQGDIVPVPVKGETEPVTLLTTSFSSPDLTVADLAALLDPSRWPSCPGFWCAMDEEASLVDGVQRFVEVVASDCAGNWKITTRLDFARRDWDDGSSSLEYWLSDDQSMPCDGMVVVDEGSILVAPTDPAGGPGVTVTSTKRIRFIEPMDGAQLAATACALGWADAGERFAFGCTAPTPVS